MPSRIKRREQAHRRCPTPSPVELVFVPAGRHGVSLDRVLAPTEAPLIDSTDAAGRSARRIEHAEDLSTCSPLCSAQSEQRSSVMPAGVAGGRARLT